MNIKINGTIREFPEGITVNGLLKLHGLEPSRVAVELNAAIIRPSDFQTTVLAQDDVIEVVRFVGGG